jgi:cytochrome c oxidase cbb3-type subunit III
MAAHRGTWIFLASLIFAIPTLAQDQPPAASPQQQEQQQQEDARAVHTREFLGLGRMPDAKMAAQGEKIFGPTCGFCHGANARGGSGPDLLRSSIVLDDNQGETIGPFLHAGRPDKGMPAFPSLADDQIRQIAEYLHLQIELAANRGTYQVLNVVTGSAQAGEAFFNGAGKCNTCHSTSGDLAHIGTRLKPADLQQTFLYPASTARKESPKVTVTMADGTQLSGTLKHLDDFYVGLDDDAGNYHSVLLGKNVTVKVEDKLAFHRAMLDKYTNQQMHDLNAYLVTLK